MMVLVPGLVFLALVSGGIAVATGYVLRGKCALPVAILVSSAVLKGWAMLAIGGFDPLFLLIVLSIATLASVILVPPVQRLRARAA